MSAPSPAAHSPGTVPDGRSVFAATTASRSVHRPSQLAITSAVLVTVMVVAAWVLAGSASSRSNPMKIIERARLPI